MNINDAKPGMPVLYVPNHANGNSLHPDCDAGKVSSIGAAVVFVKFKAQWLYDGPGQACDPHNLIRL